MDEMDFKALECITYAEAFHNVNHHPRIEEVRLRYLDYVRSRNKRSLNDLLRAAEEVGYREF